METQWLLRERCVMSGKRYVLDTNAIVALLRGHKQLSSLLDHAEWVGVSVISELEFLSFPGLGQEDEALFVLFCESVDVIGLQPDDMLLISQIACLRKATRLKLPDAIIGATAIVNDALLLTADAKLLKVSEVPTLDCM